MQTVKGAGILGHSQQIRMNDDDGQEVVAECLSRVRWRGLLRHERDHGTAFSCLLTWIVSQLANTEEWQDGQSNGALGEVFIRYVATLFAGIWY